MKFNLSPQLLAAELFLFLFFTAYTIRAQLPEDNILDFTPSSFMSDISADGKLGFTDDSPGFSIEQIRWNNYLYLKNNFSLGAELKLDINNNSAWYELTKRKLSFSQIYLQYSHTPKIFNKNAAINVRGGKLEYYPSYKEPRQIIENIDQYISPPKYLGFLFNGSVNLIEKYSASVFVTGNSPDLNSEGYKGGINNLYFSTSPKINKDLNVNFSIGKFEGTKYAVNEATVCYSHTFEDIVNFSAKAGKLIAFDDTPYGLQLNLEGYFKYIMLGVSFERRINQMNDVRYILFYWSILNPPQLVNFLNSYQFIYDTNRNILRFNIPLLSINFK